MDYLILAGLLAIMTTTANNNTSMLLAGVGSLVMLSGWRAMEANGINRKFWNALPGDNIND
jgi:hypothetical protein